MRRALAYLFAVLAGVTAAEGLWWLFALNCLAVLVNLAAAIADDEATTHLSKK